jgi:peptidoglycan hydrolase FlgJ
MAFNPRSDVILDVLNAADPARASLAAERLSALAGANAPSGDFAASLARAGASAPAASGLPAEGLGDARSRLAAIPDATDKAARAKVEFEAALLNSFVGELLPKDAPGVFGEGSAGDMWRSMLSEQISKQIAKSGALGLGRRLFATHDLAPARHGEATTAAGAVQMSANILSTPSAASVDNGGVLFAGRKRA